MVYGYGTFLYIVSLLLLLGYGTWITYKLFTTKPMIDHTSLSVHDYEKSLHFYDETLKILGYSRLHTIDIPDVPIRTAGYGKDYKPCFWISPMGNQKEQIGKARGMHIAFSAPNKEAVDAWHKKCLELGGTNNGNPGPRPYYHPGYYGGFIIDPDGWRIEAVHHSLTPYKEKTENA